MAEAACSDKFAQVRGFMIEIDSPDGRDVDTAWESVSSGEHLVPTTGAAGRFQTSAPGHKSVGEITLRGAMTDKRAVLTGWLNASWRPAHARRSVTVTITPINLDGTTSKRFVYLDCFLTGYRFPDLVASDAKDPRPLMEEVRFIYREEVVRDR